MAGMMDMLAERGTGMYGPPPSRQLSTYNPGKQASARSLGSSSSVSSYMSALPDSFYNAYNSATKDPAASLGSFTIGLAMVLLAMFTQGNVLLSGMNVPDLQLAQGNISRMNTTFVYNMEYAGFLFAGFFMLIIQGIAMWPCGKSAPVSAYTVKNTWMPAINMMFWVLGFALVFAGVVSTIFPAVYADFTTMVGISTGLVGLGYGMVYWNACEAYIERQENSLTRFWMIAAVYFFVGVYLGTFPFYANSSKVDMSTGGNFYYEITRGNTFYGLIIIFASILIIAANEIRDNANKKEPYSMSESNCLHYSQNSKLTEGTLRSITLILGLTAVFFWQGALFIPWLMLYSQLRSLGYSTVANTAMGYGGAAGVLVASLLLRAQIAVGKETTKAMTLAAWSIVMTIFLWFWGHGLSDNYSYLTGFAFMYGFSSLGIYSMIFQVFPDLACGKEGSHSWSLISKYLATVMFLAQLIVALCMYLPSIVSGTSYVPIQNWAAISSTISMSFFIAFSGMIYVYFRYEVVAKKN